MRTSTYNLTENDAVDVWLRYWAGEYQHTIAAVYGVNPGRINEILKRHKFVGSEKIAAEKRSAA